MLITVGEYRRNNKTNVQPRETGNIRYKRRRKTTQKHNTISVGHHYTQPNTNKKKTRHTALQIIGGKDEPSIVSCGTRNGHHNTELRA